LLAWLLALSFAVLACAGEARWSSVTTTAPATAPPDYSDAVDFRTRMGLAADPAHIEALAADPAAIQTGRQSGFGVPLTVAESRELLARARTADAVVDVITAYARTVPDRWAGLYLDRDVGGIVVAQFSGDPDPHRAALAKLLHPDAPFEIRRVRWSNRDLEPLWREVERQRAWFDSIGAPLTGSGRRRFAMRSRVGWFRSTDAPGTLSGSNPLPHGSQSPGTPGPGAGPASGGPT
jgi:hypothetical protein